MFKFLFVLMLPLVMHAQSLIFPGPGAVAGGGSGGLGFSRSITIDHMKVPNTDQTNFAVLVSGTYTYLKTEGNGGKVHNTNGYDVVFGTTSNCSSRLKWEVETWAASTGIVNYWVKNATLSHTVDTVLYICYGNTSIVTDQSDPVNTWNSNYKLVTHLKDGVTLSVVDSTGLNGCTNHSATATAGQIDGAGAFVGASNLYVDCGTAVSPTTAVTLDAWNTFAVSISADQTIISKGYDGSVLQWELFSTTSDGGTTNYYAAKMYSGGYHGVQATTPSSAAALHHVVGTFAGGVWKIYTDGTLNNSVTDTGPPSSTAGILLGSREPTVNPLTGKVDEARVMDTAVSADWVATEYANESSPSTFYTVGSENVL